MRRVGTIFFLLPLAFVLAHSQDEPTPNFRPKDGFVPDKETAIKVAEDVLIPVYGEKQILSERPFHAELKRGVWTVFGTLHCGAPLCAGGTAEVRISKSSGEILDMIPYK